METSHVDILCFSLTHCLTDHFVSFEVNAGTNVLWEVGTKVLDLSLKQSHTFQTRNYHPLHSRDSWYTVAHTLLNLYSNNVLDRHTVHH